MLLMDLLLLVGLWGVSLGLGASKAVLKLLLGGWELGNVSWHTVQLGSLGPLVLLGG